MKLRISVSMFFFVFDLELLLKDFSFSTRFEFFEFLRFNGHCYSA
jgi:hypothetical protein